MARRQRQSQEIEDLGDFDLPPDLDKKVKKMISEADEEVRVNFRWTKKQVDLLKRAAKLRGVRYQTYMKQLLYEGAMRDLERENNLFSK